MRRSGRFLSLLLLLQIVLLFEALVTAPGLIPGTPNNSFRIRGGLCFFPNLVLESTARSKLYPQPTKNLRVVSFWKKKQGRGIHLLTGAPASISFGCSRTDGFGCFVIVPHHQLHLVNFQVKPVIIILSQPPITLSY